MGADWLGIIGTGFQIADSFANYQRSQKQSLISAKSAESQAKSDKATALLNAQLLGTQRDMFITEQQELQEQIGEEGATAQGDRQAMVAASGMGGAGTASSQYTQTENRIKRDIGRVQTYMEEQTNVFNLQIEQQEAQAKAYGRQARYARKAGKEASKEWWQL